MKFTTLFATTVAMLAATVAAAPNATPSELEEDTFWNPLLKRQCCHPIRCRYGGCAVSKSHTLTPRSMPLTRWKRTSAAARCRWFGTAISTRNESFGSVVDLGKLNGLGTLSYGVYSTSSLDISHTPLSRVDNEFNHLVSSRCL